MKSFLSNSSWTFLCLIVAAFVDNQLRLCLSGPPFLKHIKSTSGSLGPRAPSSQQKFTPFFIFSSFESVPRTFPDLRRWKLIFLRKIFSSFFLSLTDEAKIWNFFANSFFSPLSNVSICIFFTKQIYFIFNFLFHNSHDQFDRLIIILNQIESWRKCRCCAWVRKRVCKSISIFNQTCWCTYTVSDIVIDVVKECQWMQHAAAADWSNFIR